MCAQFVVTGGVDKRVQGGIKVTQPKENRDDERRKVKAAASAAAASASAIAASDVVLRLCAAVSLREERGDERIEEKREPTEEKRGDDEAKDARRPPGPTRLA